MNRIPSLGLGVELANGTLGGLGRVGGTDGIAQRHDGVLLLQHHRHAVVAGHELHEFAEERTGAVDPVKLAGLLLGHLEHARRDQLEPLLFEVGHDEPRLAAGEGVRLDDGQCTIRHRNDGGVSYLRRALMSSTKSSGRFATPIPAASKASIFSAAVPADPEMMAPAWPMRRPGGAVWPAMKPTTGLVM